MPLSKTLNERVRLAIYEDLGGRGDITSDAVFPGDHVSNAHIEAKSEGVLAGLCIAEMVYMEIDPRIQFTHVLRDGAHLSKGDVVVELEGPTRSLLSGERLALNFLMHLSGIATLTHRFIEASGGRVEVCDTRKTTPLWRDLEKYAVTCGGGTNHRFGLFDMVMLKDTHEDGSGGIRQALRRVAYLRPKYQIAAEARTVEEVREALEAGVDLLMLDNMDDETLAASIKLVDNRVPIEITGGVNLKTIGHLAEMGVDRISIGALTHSAPAMDFSLKIDLKDIALDPGDQPARASFEQVPEKDELLK